MKLLRPLLALTLIASTSVVSAQQVVNFRGKVEDITGTGTQFGIECTDVELQSFTINLDLFVGSQTLISGTWNDNSTDPVVTVTSIQAVLESFQIGGGGKLGQDASFLVTGPVARPFAIFSSLGTFFLPFRSEGVVMLHPSTLHLIGTGVIGVAGNAEIKVPVPNNPVLVGTEIHGQGAVGLGGGSFLITNPDCETLQL